MSANDENPFHSIPWCRAYIDDPQYITAKDITRDTVTDTYDTFAAKTLNTKATISDIFCLKKRAQNQKDSFDTITFMSLGRDLNGHDNVAHGGAVATILDEVAGFVLREWSSPERLYVTRNLNVNYLKPLRTPGLVLIKGSVSLAEERKKMVTLHLHDEKQLVATGEALFILVGREAL